MPRLAMHLHHLPLHTATTPRSHPGTTKPHRHLANTLVRLQTVQNRSGLADTRGSGDAPVVVEVPLSWQWVCELSPPPPS